MSDKAYREFYESCKRAVENIRELATRELLAPSTRKKLDDQIKYIGDTIKQSTDVFSDTIIGYFTGELKKVDKSLARRDKEGVKEMFKLKKRKHPYGL